MYYALVFINLLRSPLSGSTLMWKSPFSGSIIKLCHNFSMRFSLIRQKLAGKSTFVLLSHCQVLVLVSKLIIRRVIIQGPNISVKFEKTGSCRFFQVLLTVLSLSNHSFIAVKARVNRLSKVSKSDGSIITGEFPAGDGQHRLRAM